MGVDPFPDFTDASAATGFFSAGAGLIDMRGRFWHVLVFQSAVEVFIGKRVAQADIHFF